MRIARFAAPDGPHFAVADQSAPDRWLDLGTATDELQRAILLGSPPEPGTELPAGLPLLAPIAPARIFAIGINYRDHAAETGRTPPGEPIVWVKLTSAVIPSGAAILLPAEHPQTIDYEGELAVVIGRGGRRITVDAALGQVAGYTVANDVTARDLQERMPQWTLPKSLPTFAPLGPHLLTAEEVADPQALPIETWVGGELRQFGSTGDMIFSVAELVSFVSRHLELLPGDVIETGTPAGIGWRRDPRAMLEAGQVVEVRIDPIGTLRNEVAMERGA